MPVSLWRVQPSRSLAAGVFVSRRVFCERCVARLALARLDRLYINYSRVGSPSTHNANAHYFLYSLRYYGLFKTKPTIFRPFKTFMIHLKFRFLIKYVDVSLVFSNVIFVLRTLFLISLVEPE